MLGHPWGRILRGSPGPRSTLHLRGAHSALLQELSLGFEPMSLRLSAHNPSRHKNTTAARQTESDLTPTTLPPLLFLIGLSALAHGRCLPWPPMIAGWPRSTPINARFDTHSTPSDWSKLVLYRGPLWLPFMVHINPRFWPALTCWAWASTLRCLAGMVLWNQLTVNTWLLVPNAAGALTGVRTHATSAIQCSTHHTTRLLLQWGRESLTRCLPHLFSASLFSHAIQEQLSSAIADSFLALDIQDFACLLVGEVEKLRAAGLRVLEDFLFCLGFCQ